MEKINKAVSVLLAVAVFLIIITFSIGIPIYLRPFYYGQIERLNVPDATDKTYGEIKEAYDELLDYLTLPGREFGTGSFAYSQDGAEHFADCKALFTLNIIIFSVSLLVTGGIMLFKKLGLITLWRPRGYDITLYSGVAAVLIFVAIALFVAIDFNAAFFVFHRIFFPGKSNWLFDPELDGIILALPYEFFISCGIVIVSSIVISSAAFIIAAVIRRRINDKRASQRRKLNKG